MTSAPRIDRTTRGSITPYLKRARLSRHLTAAHAAWSVSLEAVFETRAEYHWWRDLPHAIVKKVYRLPLEEVLTA